MAEIANLFETFSDATIYFVMAGVATLLFFVRLAMAVFMGLDGDGGDFDMDGGDGGHADSSAVFSLLSLLSILAFFMGAGWMGLACRLNWGLGSMLSALAAGGFGFVMMLLASTLAWGIRRFNTEIVYDPNAAMGALGRVYLTIPEKGKGQGQVEVSVGGRRKVLKASSTGPAIESFQAVTVVEVEQDGALIVEPRE